MAIVEVTIKERIASVSASIELVCNNPTDTIKFIFDDEWDAYSAKVARFEWLGKYIDVPFSGDTVQAPEITNTLYVFVGVYSDGIASTPVKLACNRSILCLGDAEYVPPNHTYWDEWKKTLDALNKAAEETNAAAQRAETATTNANKATDDAQTATNEANSARDAANEMAELAQSEFKGIVDKLTTPFEESGSIIQCHPVEGYPLDVTVHLEPVQEGEGDPYPAGGGRNLVYFPDFTATAVAGITWSCVNGAVTASGTASGNSSTVGAGLIAEATLPDGTYKVLGSSANISVRAKINENGNVKYYSAGQEFVIGEGQILESVYCQVASGVTVNETAYPMLVIASDTDATYAPYSNIRPISGWTGAELTRCGKNLFDTTKLSFATCQASGSDSELVIEQIGNYGTATLTVDVKPNTNYTLSFRLNALYENNSFAYALTTVSGSGYNTVTQAGFISKPINTGSSKKLYIHIRPTQASGVVGIVTLYSVMLEEADSPSTSAPYTGDTYATEFGQTVYGGTVDVNEGKTDKEWEILTLTGNEAINTHTDWADGAFDVYGVLNNAVSVDGYGTKANIICSHLPLASPADIANDKVNIGVGQGQTNVLFMRINKEYNTADLIKAYLAEQYAAGTPVQVAYKLATPTTLTTDAHTIPALDGLNTVYADAGDVTVKGATDPDYLNQDILNRLAALEAAAVN